jgi:LmbE family N-acetylglucosaminyl deacetylase
MKFEIANDPLPRTGDGAQESALVSAIRSLQIGQVVYFDPSDLIRKTDIHAMREYVQRVCSTHGRQYRAYELSPEKFGVWRVSDA